MEENKTKKTVMQVCREFYDNLDRSGLKDITPERGKEIFIMADTYRGMHENKDFFATIDLRFESAVQKVLSGKDGVLSLTNLVLVEDGDKTKSQIISKDIKLETDAEKILFIIRAIDPENSLHRTWADIVQTLTTDTNSFLISAHNYSKAKRIMNEYYNGFFDLKLILDEQAYLNQKEQILEQSLGSR